MEALFSATNKASDTSGWTEVAGMPLLAGEGRLLDSGAVWVSEIVFGWGPDWSLLRLELALVFLEEERVMQQ